MLQVLLALIITSPLAAQALPKAEQKNPFEKPIIEVAKKKELARGKSEYLNKKDLDITDGKGTWVNVWNYPKDVDAFVDRLDKFDIDTIYLQVNRSTTDIFKNQKGFDAILKAAHKKDIKVIGWTYCFLKEISTDVRKFVEPAMYISPDGERLDGMAADIEENTKLWAVKLYTEKIKAILPQDYPLIAIVFSPKIKQQYPWEYIASNWDVMMPMTYWHSLKDRDGDDVYNFVKDSIIKLRELTGKSDLNIHLITDGDRTNAAEIKASLDAAKDMDINAGISIYPEHLASDEMLNVIKKY